MSADSEENRGSTHPRNTRGEAPRKFRRAVHVEPVHKVLQDRPRPLLVGVDVDEHLKHAVRGGEEAEGQTPRADLGFRVEGLDRGVWVVKG